MTSNSNTAYENAKLINIGRSLSTEKNISILLEKILIEARKLSFSDGGTLYLMTEDKRLNFEILYNESKNIFLGGSHDRLWNILSVKLYVDGVPNTSVSAVCALEGKTIHIEDAYTDKITIFLVQRI